MTDLDRHHMFVGITTITTQCYPNLPAIHPPIHHPSSTIHPSPKVPQYARFELPGSNATLLRVPFKMIFPFFPSDLKTQMTSVRTSPALQQLAISVAIIIVVRRIISILGKSRILFYRIGYSCYQGYYYVIF